MKKSKKLINVFKNIIISISVLILSVLLLSIVIPVLLKIFARPLTLDNSNYVNANSLSYMPLNESGFLETIIQPDLNHFGAINLHFKPLYGQDCESIYTPTLNENNPLLDILDFEENGEILGDFNKDSVTCIRDVRVRLDITIKEHGKKSIYQTRVEIFNDKTAPFTYPIGFPKQTESRGKKYIITITPIVDNNLDSSLLGIATIENEPIISPYYHIPVDDMAQYPTDAFSIVTIKINKLLLIYLPLLLLYTASSMFLIINKKQKSIKFLYALFVSLGTINSIGLFFADSNTLNTIILPGVKTFLYTFSSLLILIILIRDKSLFKAIFNHNFTYDDRKIKPTLHQNIIYYTLIFLIFISGLVLRLYMLDYLDPYTDEYNHLVAAKRILEGDSIHNVYQRALYIVTIPVAVGFKYLGVSLFTARFVSVIANMLAIIPLYFVGRQISRTFAIIAVFLYTFNPWVVAISRGVREYAYFPLYYYIIFLIFIAVLKTIRTKINISIIILGIFLGLIAYYLAFIDKSTFRIIMFTYIGFIVYLLLNIRSISNEKIKYLLLTCSCTGIIIFLKYFVQTNYYQINPSLNLQWLYVFFGNSIHQWFFNYNIILPLLLMVITCLYLFKGRGNDVARFSIITFIILLYIYSMHFNTNFRPRYAFAAEMLYILVLSSGIFLIHKAITTKYTIRYTHLLIIMLIFLLVNFKQTFAAVRPSNDVIAPITNNHHDKIFNTFMYINTNMNSEDVLIATIYKWAHEFYGGNNFKEMYHYSYKTENRFELIREVVNNNVHGWIVIDDRRNTKTPGLPQKDIVVADKTLKYIRIDKNNIYKW